MSPRPSTSTLPPPISSLPVELLSYIFLLGTYDVLEVVDLEDTDRSPPFTTENIRTPLILSSVSQHWRRVALNTPGLWTSLCITVELVEHLRVDDEQWFTTTSAPHANVLNTTHLTSYLSRSRNYPLDILIDARDEDWDFAEPEIPSDYEFNAYTPPFSAAHMNTAISLLLPHLSRWKSLTILTDSWLPMFTALNRVNPSITTFGAPRLESLTLMRCNDFVSFPPEFEPREMKGPAFLNFGNHYQSKNILPRLKRLTLRGVHVDWQSLSSILSASESGLSSLELASHSADVRPSLPVFHQLLKANPNLTSLSITGSGPYLPDDVDDIVDAIRHDLESAPLPHLRDITVGYRTALEGRTVLELLDAPKATALTLEDATSSMDTEDVDAGSLLTYVGTGDFHHATQKYLVAYELPDGLHYQVVAESSNQNRCRHNNCKDGDDATSRSPFPLLESVTLKGVKACPRPLGAFFSAQPNLQRLELIGMSMHAVHALLPLEESSTPVPEKDTCPCPQLQSLCIRGFEHLQLQDFHFIIGGLTTARQNNGARSLREVDIHVDSLTGHTAEDVVEMSMARGTMVKIFRGEAEDECLDMDCMSDAEVEAFKVGGPFNDPLFDAYYSGGVLAR